MLSFYKIRFFNLKKVFSYVLTTISLANNTIASDILVLGCCPWDENVREVESIKSAHFVDFMRYGGPEKLPENFHQYDWNNNTSSGASNFSDFVKNNPGKFKTAIIDWATYQHVRRDEAWKEFSEILEQGGTLVVPVAHVKYLPERQIFSRQTAEELVSNKTLKDFFNTVAIMDYENMPTNIPALDLLRKERKGMTASMLDMEPVVIFATKAGLDDLSSKSVGDASSSNNSASSSEVNPITLTEQEPKEVVTYLNPEEKVQQITPVSLKLTSEAKLLEEAPITFETLSQTKAAEDTPIFENKVVKEESSISLSLPQTSEEPSIELPSVVSTVGSISIEALKQLTLDVCNRERTIRDDAIETYEKLAVLICQIDEDLLRGKYYKEVVYKPIEDFISSNLNDFHNMANLLENLASRKAKMDDHLVKGLREFARNKSGYVETYVAWLSKPEQTAAQEAYYAIGKQKLLEMRPFLERNHREVLHDPLKKNYASLSEYLSTYTLLKMFDAEALNNPTLLNLKEMKSKNYGKIRGGDINAKIQVAVEKWSLYENIGESKEKNTTKFSRSIIVLDFKCLKEENQDAYEVYFREQIKMYALNIYKLDRKDKIAQQVIEMFTLN